MAWLRWLIASILVVCLLAGTIAVFELTLQVQVARDLYREARRRPPHPFLQVLPGYAVATNVNGFRGDAIDEEKAPGAFRIFALGGSTTLGVSNSYEDSYPYILQTMLRERYPNHTIQVENAGAPWFSTAHILVNYELRVRQYNPDLVIVFEGINDLYRSFSPPWFAIGPFKSDYAHYIGPYARFLGPEVDAVVPTLKPIGSEWLWWRNLKRRFGNDPTPFNYREPNVSALTAKLKPREVKDFRSLLSFHRYYDRLLRNVLADGHRVVAASQPFLYAHNLAPEDRARIYYPQIFCAENGFYPTLESMEAGMRRFNAEARAVADAAKVPFLDFESVVPKTGTYFSDDVHLTSQANRLLARVAFDWIVSQQVVEAKGTPSR